VLWEAISQRPRTLLHSDFRLDNMFFDLADGSPFALVDWQLVQQGLGPGDVTYFVTGSYTSEERRRCEMDLLRVYHDALVANGVRDYSFDECFEDYRRSALAFYVFLVTGREQVDMAAYEGRGQALFDTMVDRYATAILDLNAGEFLP
jgi:aminoglycoside phosphotransferase (APT) family kinase protein